MDQNSEKVPQTCEIVVNPQTNNEDSEKSATLNSKNAKVKKRFSFRFIKNSRKIEQNPDKLLEMDHKEDDKTITDSQEPLGKPKITLRKIFRKSSIRKFISQKISNFTNATNAKSDRVPPINGYVWPPDSIPGVIGLRNHGNTCFMNAVLQCLSHTDILAEYFVLDQYKVDLRKRNKLNSRKFGTKGELTEQLALVLKALWTCKDAPEYSTSFKTVVERYGTQFRSSTQHDAQEFLFWLLDKVHEDLNTATKRKYKTIKNNYGRPDEVIAAETLANYVRCNNSFVQAVFRAQFRSSLTCPRCHKQSNTFDPFHCVSVQLPQLTQQAVFINILYTSQQPKQVRMGLGIPHGSSIVVLRDQLHTDTNIDAKRIIITELTYSGFGRLFSDSLPLSSINEKDNIYCIECPQKQDDSAEVVLCILNVKRTEKDKIEKFGTPFCLKVNRDVKFVELQKQILKGMSNILKSDVFKYTTPITEMFKIHLQEPSADPDTYLESCVEHPLFTEMIDLALSVQPSDSGPSHIKISLEWTEPEKYFTDMSDEIVEHESVSVMKAKSSETNNLTLEHCLDHYTKAETLSAEDAWRCPHCQKYLPVVKTLGLWSLPDILVIHFKRFRQQQLKGPQASKLTTMVNFPLNGFDMSTWHLANGSPLAPPTPASPKKSKSNAKRNLSKTSLNEDHRYDLYAVCYHQGDTLETGHYTAACKNPYDQQWYKFDDQRVSQIPIDDVPDKIVNNEAYMLFYQRRKHIDTQECSGGSSSSSDHWVSKITTAPSVVKLTTTIATTVPITIVEPIKKEVEEKVEELKTPIAEEEVMTEDEIPEMIKSLLNLDEIEAIDGDDIPEVRSFTPLPKMEGTVKHSKDDDALIVVAMSPEKVIKEENHVIKVIVEMTPITPVTTVVSSDNEEEEEEENEVDEMEEVKVIVREVKECDKIEELMSQQAINNLLWDDTNRHSDTVGKIKISDLISMDNIEHTVSSSLPKNYMLKECDTISRIRGVSSCSKDTLLFIDQPSLLNGDEDGMLENSRAHWISPVTPHKLITVSPKN
ncbi:unnamed protein product [Diamesa serratosioi]